MDRELVERARSGDHDAFEVLAAGVVDHLYRLAAGSPARRRSCRRCGPGSARALLARPAISARGGPLRCLAGPHPDARDQRRVPAWVALPSHDHGPRPRARHGGRCRSHGGSGAAPNEALPASRSSTAAWSSFDFTSASPSRRRPRPLRSLSGRPSPGCTTRPRRCGERSRPIRAPRSQEVSA